MLGEAILITIALAYSAAVAAIGRRLPRPAAMAASSTAVAILIGVPLLPDPVAQRVDHLVPVVGAGRLLVHLAFMTATCGLFLTIVLGTRRWAWPQQLAVGGAGVLTALFVVLWLAVHTLPRSIPRCGQRYDLALAGGRCQRHAGPALRAAPGPQS